MRGSKAMTGPKTDGSPSAARRPSILLILVVLAWASALACYGFIWAADPYELRFLRPGERLADHAYPDVVVPRLIPAAADEGADVVVVGGSTVLGFTPAMLHAAFPEAKNPINLSYFCATDDDL